MNKEIKKSSNLNPGKFIVVEGLDASGTTTQSSKIHEYFLNNGLNSFLTSQPSESKIGRLIRSLFNPLNKSIDRTEPMFSKVIGHLFAADREYFQSCKSGIVDKLSRGINVVCSRYYLSTAAYNSNSFQDVEKILKLSRDTYEFLTPDHTVYLDTPIDTCFGRLKRRPVLEHYENKVKLLEVSGYYHYALSIYEGRLSMIDCPPNLDADVVFQRILEEGVCDVGK